MRVETVCDEFFVADAQPSCVGNVGCSSARVGRKTFMPERNGALGLMHRGGRFVTTRHRFKQRDVLEVRLAAEAERLREEAKSLPPGAARDEMLRKARQAETGSQMSEWLRSPGLQPPD